MKNNEKKIWEYLLLEFYSDPKGHNAVANSEEIVEEIKKAFNYFSKENF